MTGSGPNRSIESGTFWHWRLGTIGAGQSKVNGY
jgi:hypothetical protein